MFAEVENLGVGVTYAGHISFSKLVERRYLTSIINALSQSDSISKDVGLLILSCKSYVKAKSLSNISSLEGVLNRYPKWVVIYVSDEGNSIPNELCERCDAVFKAYLPDTTFPSNLFHFPVGVANFDHSISKPIPVEKDINVFFSGNLNEQRLRLHKQLSGCILPRDIHRWCIKWKGSASLDLSNRFSNSVIRFSREWGGGMKPAEYHQFLLRSKIALCPAGFRTSETFRHFEALRAGCVVISEPLPRQNPFYQTEAIIQVNSYAKMIHIVEDLLQDQPRLGSLMQASRNWYDKMCSPKAVADYVMTKINTV